MDRSPARAPSPMFGAAAARARQLESGAPLREAIHSTTVWRWLSGFPPRPLVPGTPAPPRTFANNSNTAAAYLSGVVAGNSPGGTGKVASQRVLNHSIASPFFTGPLRSPARLQNTFANESFVDEVAAAVKADPVQYRVRHLSHPRLIAALNPAPKHANWHTPPSPKPGNPLTRLLKRRSNAS